MHQGTVAIRLANLFRPDLTACAKLVWLETFLQPDTMSPKDRRSPTRIQRVLGISRPTIRKALSRLDQPVEPKVPDALRDLINMEVTVFRDLITDKTVPPMARVIYCVLFGLAKRAKEKPNFLASYTSIAAVLDVQPRTVRKSIRKLIDAGWLAIHRPTKKATLTISFPNPQLALERAQVRRAQRRLEKTKAVGETLLREYLDIMVEDADYKDDYAPPALTNPLTNERLDFDRYYAKRNIAIEFNGPQHDGPTERFPEQVARKQIERDRIKQEICKRQQINLYIVRPEDLSYRRLYELFRKVLPLRNLTGREPILRFLDERAAAYRQAIRQIRQRAQQVSTT